MGTYTANYNLFMPSIGEQGWGELVNGNFSTIDTTMKGFDGRIGTLETETTSLDGRVTTLEAGNFETVNAGTVIADKFYGNVCRDFVTTKPYPWSVAVSLPSGSGIIENFKSGTFSQSFTISISLSQFSGVGYIENTMTDYTFTTKSTSYSSFVSATFTVTDLLTNEVTTINSKTSSHANKTMTETIQLPVISTVVCNFTGSKSNADGAYKISASLSPSGNALYLK